MLNKGSLVDRELDKEWIELIKKAYEMGLSIQQVKEFFRDNKK
ncbi:anti-repressor SinI family protein [Priestia aryabhattai]